MVSERKTGVTKDHKCCGSHKCPEKARRLAVDWASASEKGVEQEMIVDGIDGDVQGRRDGPVGKGACHQA